MAWSAELVLCISVMRGAVATSANFVTRSTKLVLVRCVSGTELELSVPQVCYDNMDREVTCAVVVILDRFRAHRDL